MKKINILFLFYLLASANVYAVILGQPSFNLDFALTQAPKAGAANVTELSNAILLALQTADTGQLNGYLPTDAELKVLKKQGSEDMKAILENQTVTSLSNSFQSDVKKIIQEGVGKTLNWADMHLAETKTGKGTAKNLMLRPVEMVLQTKNNQLVSIVFETIHLHNRYYLFRGIQLKP